MQISIFPKAKAHPQSKDEKMENAKFFSKPYEPVIADIETPEELYEIITQYCWSPFIFRKYRSNEDFIHCDILTLDIDDGMTIPQAERICEKNRLMCFIAPTVSHSPNHHKFRMLFPTVSRISDRKTFADSLEYLAAKFPLDLRAKDAARAFYSCLPSDEAVFIDGEMIVPQKRRELSISDLIHNQEMIDIGEFTDKSILELLKLENHATIAKSVWYFLENAHTGLEGEWTCSLNACCFTLALYGTNEEIILLAVQKVAPQPLDSRDMDTIERAIRDGLKAKLELDKDRSRDEYLEKVKEQRKTVKKRHLI